MADEILLEVFRQNFENMRHAERERTGFMQFYALVIAGMLGFMAYVNFTDVRPLWGVLTALSFFGFLTNRRWSANSSVDENKAIEAANKMPEELREVVSFGAKERYISFVISLRKLFPWMYALMTLVFLVFAIFSPSF